MKLSFVEVCGFRGFLEKCRLDFPDGFAVLVGRNGVGKSSILDAVDFALTGTINKYGVTAAKGGGLDDHIWWVGEDIPADCYVEVGFRDLEGRDHIVRRSRHLGFQDFPPKLRQLLCDEGTRPESWASSLSKTTLLRDEEITALSLDLPEQARFVAVRDAIGSIAGPDHGARTTALLAEADRAKADQDKITTALKDELSRTLSALTEARSTAERQVDTKLAMDIVHRLGPTGSDGLSANSASLRDNLAERKRIVSVLGEAFSSLQLMRDRVAYMNSAEGIAELVYGRETVAQANLAVADAEKQLRQLQQAREASLSNDVYADAMVSLLESGQALGVKDGHCPLCDSEVTLPQFTAAVERARAELSEHGRRVSDQLLRLAAAKKAFSDAQSAAAKGHADLEILESRNSALEKGHADVALVLGQHGVSYSLDDLTVVESHIAKLEDDAIQLERAIYILESSAAHDRVSELEGRIAELRAKIEQESDTLLASERAAQLTRQIDSAAKTVRNEILTEQFDTVLPLLKELYSRLRPHTDWRDIDVGFGGRVRASLNFSVGDGRNPQFLFSSGQRRAAGLAFLIAIHLSRPWCHLHSLLLDDPVQHVDDYRALNLVEVLSAIRRTGRQVIVAVEDEALAEVLCRRLRGTLMAPGRRFTLATNDRGSAALVAYEDVPPLQAEVLKIAAAP